MSSPDPVLADRDVRQRDLVPPARLATVHAVVIGVGAVGRQVALQLASMGVPEMTICDPDVVGIENMAVQGFLHKDLGEPKVDAVGSVCSLLNPRLELHAVAERFQRSTVRSWPRERDVAVFAAVDTIDARRLIWEAVRGRAVFFADGRVAAEAIRVLASSAPHDRTAYSQTLFAAGEEYAGACTGAKMTIYCANLAAALMLSQFARWLRGQRVVADQLLNLLAAELTVCE